MTSVIAYIGLGSNLNSPYLQIKNAIVAINLLEETQVLKNSGYYKSKPMGPQNQADFINAVVKIKTQLSVYQLLEQCQKIEENQGRIKQQHWGARCIDLDILLYANEVILTKKLTIPHIGITERDFVYLPLLKINKAIEIPKKGKLKTIIANKKSGTNYHCDYVRQIE